MKKKKKHIKVIRNKPLKRGELVIKRIKLNNKGRKGHYYYLNEYGKKPRYYKYVKGVSVESYLLRYQKKTEKGKKKIKAYESPAQKYIKEKTFKKIEKFIGKGISNTELRLSKIDRRNVFNAYKKLLTPMVKNKGVLNVLSMSENIKKMKSKLKVIIDIKSKNDEINFSLITFNKTIDEINSDFSKIREGKTLMSNNLGELLKKGYQIYGIPKGINYIQGDHYLNIPINTISEIKLKITFVKAK